MQSSINKARSKPRNVLRGIVPTADTFDTAPSDLAKCTDGNPLTDTGEGTKVTSAGGVYGNLTFDLGGLKTVLCSGKVGIRSSTSSIYGMAYISYDGGNTYIPVQPAIVATTTSTTNTDRWIIPFIITADHLRLTFNVNAAATAYAKVYEMSAYEIGV